MSVKKRPYKLGGITVEELHERIKGMPLLTTKVIISQAANKYNQWYSAYVFDLTGKIQKKVFSVQIKKDSLLKYFNLEKIDRAKINRAIADEWWTVLPANLIPSRKVKHYPYYRFSRYFKCESTLEYWFNYFKGLSIPCAIEKTDRTLPYALWVWGKEAVSGRSGNVEEMTGEIIAKYNPPKKGGSTHGSKN